MRSAFKIWRTENVARFFRKEIEPKTSAGYLFAGVNMCCVRACAMFFFSVTEFSQSEFSCKRRMSVEVSRFLLSPFTEKKILKVTLHIQRPKLQRLLVSNVFHEKLLPPSDPQDSSSMRLCLMFVRLSVLK